MFLHNGTKAPSTPPPTPTQDERWDLWSHRTTLSQRSASDAIGYDLGRVDSVDDNQNASKDGNVVWDTSAVLSCGGEGLRDLYQLFLLDVLMREIAELEDGTARFSADSPLFRYHAEEGAKGTETRSRVRVREGTFLPCHYFDYIGGTSTGGIIAVMLGRLRMSTGRAIKSFRSIWLRMAARSRYESMVPLRRAKKSNSTSLHDAVKTVVEEHKDRIKDLRTAVSTSELEKEAVFASDEMLCRTIVVAMPDATFEGIQRPHFFRSYDSPQAHFPIYATVKPSRTDRSEGTYNLVQISEVLEASVAAPGVFKGVDIGGIKFRDGSILNANPAHEILLEIQSLEMQYPRRRSINTFVGLGPVPEKTRRFHSSTQRQSNRASDVRDQLKGKLGDRFHYFPGPLGPSELFDLEINGWRMDGSGDKTFARIKEATEKYCKQQDIYDEIRRCARSLVALRQRRARTSRWERFALGMRYDCSRCRSSEGHSCLFETRDAFLVHLVFEHNEPPVDKKNWNHMQRLCEESQIYMVE